MKKTLIAIAILLAYAISTNAQDQNDEANQLIRELVTQKDVVGATAGYTVDGTIIWESAVGFANRKEKIAMGMHTKVRTASIAKSMTAIAIMQLVEKGLIDINAAVETYIPNVPQKGKAKITVRQLLSHTSGISGYKNGKEAETKKYYPTLTHAMGVFMNRKLEFEPGAKFSYTSYGFVVLGVIIENVSGLPYEEYMQTNIWDKVGMPNTAIDKMDEQLDNESALYHRKKRGKLKDGSLNNLSNRIPAGGLVSTTEDLLKFGNALLDNTLVSAETLELMIQHHSLEKENNGYGFGFYLYGKKPNEGEIYGHSGAQTGSSTQLFVIPSLKTVIVTLANTSGAGRELSTLAGNLIPHAKKVAIKLSEADTK